MSLERREYTEYGKRRLSAASKHIHAWHWRLLDGYWFGLLAACMHSRGVVGAFTDKLEQHHGIVLFERRDERSSS